MSSGNKKIVLIMPAYNAASSLVDFVHGLPTDVFDQMILVDDGSGDDTYGVAKKLGLRAYRHVRNLGYGGNIKQCFKKALAEGADVIVELHPDGEYRPDGIKPALKAVGQGAGLVLGNRFTPKTHPLKRGMFWWKYPVLRGLNAIDNLVLGTHIPDLHQGFRVYSRDLLESSNYLENSDDYLFTFEIILQALYLGMPVASVPVTTHYQDRKRGAPLEAAARYTLQTFGVLGRYKASQYKVMKHPMFKRREAET